MAKERTKCGDCGAVIVNDNLLHHRSSGRCERRATRKRQRRSRHNLHVSMMRDRKEERRRQASA